MKIQCMTLFSAVVLVLVLVLVVASKIKSTVLH